MEGILNTLLASALGGAIGSTVTAIVSLKIHKQQERTRAYEALWDYHYALIGFALVSAPGPDEQVSLLKSSLTDVRTALRKAYPYAHYIRKHQRDELFRKAYVNLNVYTDDAHIYGESVYDVFSSMSEVLREEMDIAFPNTFGGIILSKIKWSIPIKTARK